MTTTARPIGKLKSKATVYCTVCGESHTRNLKAYVYENTPEEIEIRCDAVDRVNAVTARKGAFKYASQVVKSGASNK